MAEIGNTFSDVVDKAIVIAGRGDTPQQREQISSFARTSIRECEVHHLFHRNMIEDTITADSEPFIWTRPNNFRILKTVKYPNAVYPDFIPPGRKQKDKIYYYYAGPTYFVFSGINLNETLDIAYFEYFKKLAYYDFKGRPANYIIQDMKWQYLDGNGNYVDSLGTAALDEAARDKVTHWLLFDWFDLVLEGTLAKVFKLQGDPRSATHFSLFSTLKRDLLAGEISETLNQ